MDTDQAAIAQRNRGYYEGFFKPVEAELAGEVEYHGEVPADLVGQYMRIGPNPRALPSEPGSFLYHSFDGDGMLHAVSFRNGRAFYSNKWVRTEKLKVVERSGEPETGFSFGEALVGNMCMQADFDMRTREIMGRANTNVMAHAGRVYALHEADKPYQVSASWDPEKNLETLERSTFGGKLAHPMTAHPKVDPVTGHMMCFGLNPVDSPPCAHYSVIDDSSELCHYIKIPLPRSVMMHDMAITPNYSILLDFNFQFELPDLFKGKAPWSHLPDEPARFGVLPRFAKDASEVKWFEIPPCCIFHIPCAWEEDTPEGPVVVVIGNRCDSPTVVNVAGKAPPSYFHEWRLNVETGEVVSSRKLTDTFLAFPGINPRYEGRPTRFVYGASVPDYDAAVKKGWLAYGKDSFPVFDGVGKVDLETGTVTHLTRLESAAGNESLVCEVAFAPRASESGEASVEEDDGYIVTFLYDPIEDMSECVVLDAKDLELVSRLGLPGRVPGGFHCAWVEPDAIVEGDRA